MNILIVKTSSLGDLIHTFPAVQFLRKKYPHARIDWVVEEHCVELVFTHPDVDHVISINTRSWRKGKKIASFIQFYKTLRTVSYDLLIDFQGNTKSAFVTFLAKASQKIGFGKGAVSEWPNLLVTHQKFIPEPNLSIRASNLFLAQSYFKDFTSFANEGVQLHISDQEKETIYEILKHPFLENRKKILLSAGSAWKNKQMDETSLLNFLKAVQKDSSYAFLLIWGNQQEKQLAKRLEKELSNTAFVIDKLPLPCLQNLMNEMDAVIAMDSLALHLAGTTKTKAFAIFGPSSAAKYMPEGSKHGAFQGICPYNKTFEKRCPILRSCSSGACIRSPIENELFRAWEKFAENIS